MQPQRDLRPNFLIQRQEGTFEKEVIRFTKEKVGDKIINKKTVEKRTFNGGWMVLFPGKGHSIFIESEEELARLGFDQAPDLVDMEYGDVVTKLAPSLPTMPVKQQVAKKAAA